MNSEAWNIQVENPTKAGTYHIYSRAKYKMYPRCFLLDDGHLFL